jgi:hypothetical protein
MSDTRKVKKVIPTGTTAAEKQAASEVAASIYLGPNGERLFAGRSYDLPPDFARMLVARKGWRYVGEDGQPTEETAEYTDTRIHPGTAEWIEKYGDRTVHDVMLEEKLEAAKAAESQATVEPRRNRRGVAASEPPAVE